MQNTLRFRFGSALLVLAWLTMYALAMPAQAGSSATPSDGQHDFDWEIGTWKTELRRLAKPLSGSNEWVEYSGTSVIRKVLDGRANLVEGPSGRIEGVSLRLYNPQARQWSLNYASVRNGAMTQPVFGSFREGRGEFFGQDSLDGRAILVRFIVSKMSDDSARFEQAYSVDGGRTWETNWVAVDRRVASINPDSP
jgi:hypothetical protein